jgi:CHAD domain-containing protein
LLIEDFKKIFYIDKKFCKLIITKKNGLVNEYLKISNSFNLIRVKRTFKLIEKYLNLFSDSDLENQINAFKQCRNRFIEKYSQSSNEEFNLHKARKQIKDLAYLYEMSKATILVENMPLAKYKEAGHILGDWHDRDVMHGLLIQLKGHNAKLNNDNLYILEIKIKEDKENLKNKYFDIYKSW